MIILCNVTTSICAGLFLSLRGTPIDGDGFVDVDDIGNNDNANNGLLCLTNATNCCTNTQGITSGAWFFPNGTLLPTIANVGNTGFGRDRGQSVTRLYRRSSPSERGRFRCNLLEEDIYVNICE